jgi:hypothetical protein
MRSDAQKLNQSMIHDRIAIPHPHSPIPQSHRHCHSHRQGTLQEHSVWLANSLLALPVPFPVVTPRSYTLAVAEGFLQ